MTYAHPSNPLGYFEITPAINTAVGRDIVETLWTVHAAAPRNFLVLPDGRADLIARFRVCKDGRCVDIVPMLVGPSSLSHSVPVAAEDGFVGARLRPGMLEAIGAASEVADRRLVGADAIARLPALRHLPTTAESIEAVAKIVLAIAEELDTVSLHQDVKTALDRLHLVGGRLGVSALATLLGLPQRRLHRLFVKHVGLSPQQYAAVLRFQRAVRLQHQGLNLALTAYEAGYADQAHMTRAFRQHSGFTPSRMPEVALGSLPLD